MIDLKQEEAAAAAKDLVDWFGNHDVISLNIPSAEIHGSVTHGEANEGEIEALGLGADVSSEESVKAAFAEIKEKFGRVDVGCISLQLSQALT